MIKSLLISILTIFTFLENYKIQDFSINNYFYDCDNISILYDNNYYNINNNEILLVKNSLIKICENSHEMPAFGVSIHNETINALKNGIWLILKFNTKQTHLDMPFDELLINVVSDSYGFNIIRGNNGKYEGRCFYLSLENNMNNLKSTIDNLIKNNTG